MRLLPLLLLTCFFHSAAWSAVPIQGELKKWHKLTLDFSGPTTSESATPNPFTHYRLDVTFTHVGSGKIYRIPGYFAADGNAANTSATSGNLWRAHFAPDATGTWTYLASFREGSNIATSTAAGTSGGFFDGDTGSFIIADTDKTGRDFRSKGRLEYVGRHHLRFAETGDYFMKAGVDAPENLLAYTDFDGAFKTDGNGDDLIKDWTPHVADWRSGDPVWQGSKGKGLIGAINYLAAEGLNAFSFLTMNINGDDKNVFPYTTYGERSRLDVSRLDQWEIVFEHGTRNGMHLNFKTQEIENQNLLDGGDLGNQRILYYRELIARFGHNLGLNWNLGEECTATTARKTAWAQYFHDSDPYKHPIVIHNTTSVLHREMMGAASKLTGFSLQLNAADFTDMFSMTKDYIDRSVAAGKPWVVACDEPGDSRYSLRPDSDPGSSHTDARKHALWGNIMAGGAGVEWYFGYSLPNSDLTCEDFRSRDAFWPFCRYTLDFLESSDVPFELMKNQNSLVSGSGNNANRCLAKTGDAYLVHLPSGGSATLNLASASGSFAVKWFNPRTGAVVNRSNLNGGGTVNLGSPPDSTNLDWVVLLRSGSGGGVVNDAPMVSAGPDVSATLSGAAVSVAINGNVSDDGLPASAPLAVNWTRVSGPAAVAFSSASTSSTAVTFTAIGTYVLRLAASDGDLSDSDETTVTITASGGSGGGLSFQASHDTYLQNGSNYNNADLRAENTSRSRVTYLQFDLTTLTAAASGARIRLTESNDPSGGTITLRVFAALSNNWTETSLTSSNAPARGEQIAVFTGEIADGMPVEFNVGSRITGPGIYSFIVQIDQGFRDISFASAENAAAADRPQVIVETGGAPVNQAPLVNAGSDKTATLISGSATVFLTGTVSDDGLPADAALSPSWTRISGPGVVLFSSSGSAATSASFTVAGSYVLRLSASDSLLSASDEVTVTVVAPGSTIPASFGPTHDSYLQNGTNYNNADLRIESSSRSRISYLQFDLSALTSSPATARIRLTEGSDTSGGTMTLRLFAASSNRWTESGLTGGNAPAKGTELASYTGDVPNGKLVEFDVSAWIPGPGIYSFIIQADASTRDVSFASSENSTVAIRPQMIVAFAPPPALAVRSVDTEPGGPAIVDLSFLALPGGSGIHLRFKGLADVRYIIERSTNLVDWESIHTTTPALPGTIDFTDPAPPPRRGFYRVTSEP